MRTRAYTRTHTHACTRTHMQIANARAHAYCMCMHSHIRVGRNSRKRHTARVSSSYCRAASACNSEQTEQPGHSPWLVEHFSVQLVVIAKAPCHPLGLQQMTIPVTFLVLGGLLLLCLRHRTTLKGRRTQPPCPRCLHRCRWRPWSLPCSTQGTCLALAKQLWGT